jgi:hypothetical protein
LTFKRCRFLQARLATVAARLLRPEASWIDIPGGRLLNGAATAQQQPVYEMDSISDFGKLVPAAHAINGRLKIARAS